MSKDYSNLKELLESVETFPHLFTYKFIGKNTPAFAMGVAALEKRFPGLTLQASRLSKADSHLAFTYTLNANDADEIIDVYKAVETVQDLMVIL